MPDLACGHAALATTLSMGWHWQFARRHGALPPHLHCD
jgi:hypothetical protein